MTWALGSFSRSVLGSAYEGRTQRAIGVASGACSEFALRAFSRDGRRALVASECWRRGLSRGTPFVGSAGNGGVLRRAGGRSPVEDLCAFGANTALHAPVAGVGRR